MLAAVVLLALAGWTVAALPVAVVIGLCIRLADQQSPAAVVVPACPPTPLEVAR